jgi:branched-chain amino acid transport system ATP-binding protein
MLLSIENMKVHYGGAEIIKGISFNISEGEIITLIGSNGAGKTTALRSLAGLKKLTSGDIVYKGKNIGQMSPQNIVREGISLVPEGRGLFPYMAVFENLHIGAYIRKDKKKIVDDLERIYSSFPILRTRSKQKAGTLSGGEQQMLAIACALMAGPELLLLDEPSTGLSPIMVGEIGKIIKEVHDKGTNVLLIEQNARLALGLSMRGYVLETGLITLTGEADELKNSEHVKKAYLGE